MKNIFSKTLVTLLFLLALGNQIRAQSADTLATKNKADSAEKVKVNLTDGTNLIGILISINLEEIELKTDLAGIVKVKQMYIKSIEKLKYQKPENNSGYVTIYNPNNPNNMDIVKFGGGIRYPSSYVPVEINHKYFLNNNYHGIKKNEMYYQNILFLYNGLDYGLTNNFSIGGGAFLIGFVGFFNFHARTQYQVSKNFSIGLAYNHFAISSSEYSDNQSNQGIFSGGVTVGNPNINVSVSVGNSTHTSSNGNNVTTNNFTGSMLSIAGSLKLGEKAYLVSDNSFFSNSSQRIFSVGVRISSRTTAFDAGLMGNTYQSDEGYYSFSTGNYISDTKNRSVAYPFLSLQIKIK